VGDRAWKALLERHDILVRRELGRWRGHEVNTTGDGFLAFFDSPAQGTRCALAIRDSLASLGLELRAGLHTGECQVRGTDLVGLAVHIAARVNAVAGPGEVLVSGTVRDLVAGLGLSFTDRGVHSLKGVPGEWRLFAASR
jgi:class 3 adenylate cyclase